MTEWSAWIAGATWLPLIFERFDALWDRHATHIDLGVIAVNEPRRPFDFGVLHNCYDRQTHECRSRRFLYLQLPSLVWERDMRDYGRNRRWCWHRRVLLWREGIGFSVELWELE